jgi:hypothetical protein
MGTRSGPLEVWSDRGPAPPTCDALRRTADAKILPLETSAAYSDGMLLEAADFRDGQ